MAHTSLMNARPKMLMYWRPLVPCLSIRIGNVRKINNNASPFDLRAFRSSRIFNRGHAKNTVSSSEGGDTRECPPKRNDGTPGPESVSVNEITKEIHFYRDGTNNFKESTYVDVDSPYGPPLAILLPWLSPDKPSLTRLIRVYGGRGFDVVTVQLSKTQLLYPRKGGALRVVQNFLDYLNAVHRYRPYIVHGFSTGAYVYGEMMAQISDQYDSYYAVVGNVKGCLWDSPVEFSAVAHVAGKTLYPRNIVKRWFFERAVAQHLSANHRESVDCWERSRNHFCCQKCKVPNLFFVSEKDPLSNPGSIEAVRTRMEQNGIPTYMKTWQDSKHLEHFTKYFDEYLHGLNLFFSLANLFPDPAGKFLSYSTNSYLTDIRLKNKVKGDRVRSSISLVVTNHGLSWVYLPESKPKLLDETYMMQFVNGERSRSGKDATSMSVARPGSVQRPVTL